MNPVELASPPADPVEWQVSFSVEAELGQVSAEHSGCLYQWEGTGCHATLVYAEQVTARTAFDAHRQVCSRLPGSPPFGSCVVTRVEADHG